MSQQPPEQPPHRRVRIVRASDAAPPPVQPEERVFTPAPTPPPRRGASQGPTQPAPPPRPRPRPAESYYAGPYEPQGADLRAYFIGGTVAAALALLLIVIWAVITPDNPFKNSGGNVPAPAPAVNTGGNPFDIPTVPEQIQPDGTDVPAIPPAQPTGNFSGGLFAFNLREDAAPLLAWHAFGWSTGHPLAQQA